MPYPLFSTAPVTDGVAVTGAGTTYSAPIRLTEASGFATQLAWTGTPTGALTLWASNKETPNFATDADWVQITTTIPQPAGAAGNGAHEVSTRFAMLRYKYVAASGTGVLFAYASVPRGV